MIGKIEKIKEQEIEKIILGREEREKIFSVLIETMKENNRALNSVNDMVRLLINPVWIIEDTNKK